MGQKVATFKGAEYFRKALYDKYSDPLLSTFSKHLWQRLQHRVFLGRTLQTWHTCIWGVSPILLCRSSQTLVRLDGERCCTAIFMTLQRCYNRALAGPLKDIQRLVLKPLLRCLGCVLRVVVLLEAEPLPQSGVLSALEQVFIKDLSVLCSVHPCLDPRSTT